MLSNVLLLIIINRLVYQNKILGKMYLTMCAGEVICTYIIQNIQVYYQNVYFEPRCYRSIHVFGGGRGSQLLCTPWRSLYTLWWINVHRLKKRLICGVWLEVCENDDRRRMLVKTRIINGLYHAWTFGCAISIYKYL